MITSVMDLTEIELRVLMLKATGHTNKEMSELLKISTTSITKIVRQINEKCDETNFCRSLKRLSQQNIY